MSELTADQIPLLTDAELNQACAERVMGWKREGDFYTWGDGMNSEPVQSWRPAASLADAARCTERMCTDGWRFGIEIAKDQPCLILAYKGRHNSFPRFSLRAATEARTKAEACLRAAMREER